MATRCYQEPARRAVRVLPFAVIILLSAALFSPFIFRGRVFLAADLLYGVYPWKSLAPPGFKLHNRQLADPVNHNYAAIYNQQLHGGGLRNWNPYILTGIPNTGLTAMSGMSGRWYPLKLLYHRLLSTPVALSLLLFTHVTLMGLTMFLYLSEVGAGRWGALFGGVAFMFNGCAMAWLEYESVVAASALLPLLLLCLERLARERRCLWAALGAGILGLSWLMSHIQYMIYTCLLLVFYAMFLVWRRFREGDARGDLLAMVASFTFVATVGALIGSIEILPAAELLRHSGRNLMTYSFNDLYDKVGRIPWRQLVTLIFPDYFGNPVLGFTALSTPPSQGLMMFNELALNVGVPTLLAFLGAVVAPKKPQACFFLGMTLLALVLMTGTILAYPFFKLVPGMDRMTPTRTVWLFTFSMAAAAGLGFGRLEELRGGRRVIYLGLLLLLAGLAVIFSLVSSRPAVISFFNAESLSAAGREAPDILDRLRALRSVASPVMLKPLLLALASTVLFILVIRAPKAPLRVVLLGGLLGLLAFELIGAAAAYNTTVAPAMVYPRTPGIEFLQRQQGLFRVAANDTPPNGMAPFGLQDAGGYSSVWPSRNNELLSLIQLPLGMRFTRWVTFNFSEMPRPSLLDLLNVKYVLTAPGRGIASERFRLVYRGDMDVYENPKAMPRAYAVHQAFFANGADDEEAAALIGSSSFDMRNGVVLHERPDETFLRGVGVPDRPPSVSLVSYGEDDVTVEAQLSANGWLVLTDAFYPGWEASVDGVPAPVLRANISCRAVALPAGGHRVDFRYRPGSLRWGRILTTVGACLVLAALIASLLMRGQGFRPTTASRS